MASVPMSGMLIREAWVNGRFVWGFTTYGPTEPYNNGEHDLIVPEGYREDNRGAAVTPDGTAWWGQSSHRIIELQSHDRPRKYLVDKPLHSVAGLPAAGLMDIAADPDGSLWIVDNSGRLLRFTPSTQTVQVWPGVSSVRRIVWIRPSPSCPLCFNGQPRLGGNPGKITPSSSSCSVRSGCSPHRLLPA